MKLHKSIKAELEGVPHHVVNGGRHLKIFVHGKLAGIAPKGGGFDRGAGMKNIVAQIRRAARQPRP
jgi:hypothetical protein